MHSVRQTIVWLFAFSDEKTLMQCRLRCLQPSLVLTSVVWARRLFHATICIFWTMPEVVAGSGRFSSSHCNVTSLASATCVCASRNCRWNSTEASHGTTYVSCCDTIHSDSNQAFVSLAVRRTACPSAFPKAMAATTGPDSLHLSCKRV